jgi:hypothetical protein
MEPQQAYRSATMQKKPEHYHHVLKKSDHYVLKGMNKSDN